MSNEIGLPVDRRAELLRFIEGWVNSNISDPDQRAARLAFEQARVARMPTYVNLTVELDDPFDIWKLLALGASCAVSQTDDALMFALQTIGPRIFALGVKAGLNEKEELKKLVGDSMVAVDV